MAKTYTYRDAVRLLGGETSALVGVIDRISSAAMLALGAAGVQEILSWFDPRAEFVQLSHRLIADLHRRVGPARGRSRTEILTAAHSIIVVTAYFDAFTSVRLPFNPKKLKLAKADQLTLIGGEVVENTGARSLLTALLDLSLPLPSPYATFEQTCETLVTLYQELSANLVRFLTGMALWDSMDDTTRRRVDRILGDVPKRAVTRYEELLRATAAQCPEFFVWASLQNHAATRRAVARAAADVRGPLLSLYEEVGELKVGLSRLERLLSRHTERADLTGAVSALAAGHRAALVRPIVEMTALDTDLGLAIPALRDAYIDPAYRMRVCSSSGARPAEESWWKDRPHRSDLPAFLAGFFTSPEAGDRPLVILGQPGSGKSVLTRVLAARLPRDDFVVIRVELRTTPADAPLQDQIETAVHRLTGEHVTYPDLVRSAAPAIPVILLDGFDELLQSTGLSRSNYLEQVREFQRREADLGRPVAVVVTTRTVVAERARFPTGTVAVRLEPFGDAQVATWIDVWNTGNAEYFRRAGVRPLSAESALRHRPLAAQPLLLLMLALYDADGNALGAAGESLREADLYEGLLDRFARREIAKLDPPLSPGRLAQEVETELERLAVVAFAMFNRGRQSVRDKEVDQDVRDLLGGLTAPSYGPGGFEEPLTAAEIIVGRFFFIHESQASFKDSRTRTYEFLHATFGEYLVARMVGRELGRLARLHEADSLATVRRNSGRLRALLSFAPLITRTPVVTFLRGIVRSWPAERLERTREIVADLIARALLPVSAEETLAYAPLPLTAPARHATLSVNAVLLGLVCADGRAAATELFGTEDVVGTWRSHTSLWKSQLSPEAWSSLVYGVGVERVGLGRRDVVLTLGAAPSADIDLRWSVVGAGPTSDLPQSVPAEANFLCSLSEDLLAAAVAPVPNREAALSSLIVTGNGVTTEAQLLVLLGMPTAEEIPSEDLTVYCDLVLERAEHRPEAAGAYLDLVLNCYQYRLRAQAPLGDLALLHRVVDNPYATWGHVVRAAECALEEWAGRDWGLRHYEETRQFVRSAGAWLDQHPGGNLTELWVAAVEAGFPAGEISTHLAEVERFIHESGEDLVQAGVSRARLRRALRLSAS